MYKVISKIPFLIGGKHITEFTGGSITLSHLLVRINNIFVFWWHLERIEIWDCNMNKLIKILYPVDIFDIEFLASDDFMPCDL